ncbi:hypothetical protein BDQ12DRAFT_724281 [Crucibulum laeve]|uniref:DUF6534 domain-containing protein n=1 Tax=Crucibulum laeve TaxID=68775 RepID=A0A5C3LW38_9AGAR|nr:hypothetical protein BDQ12DRAFT_724281 [Crucibulum laeve]
MLATWPLKSKNQHRVTHFNRLEIPVTCWLVLQTATDLILNGLLIYILARQRTGVQRTDTVLKRLIRGAVQSGLFVTVFAMGDLFSFRFRSATNLYAMFAYPIGRVYTNTLMDTLNTRVNLRAIMDTTIDMDATSAFHMPALPTSESAIQHRYDIKSTSFVSSSQTVHSQYDADAYKAA